MVCVCTSQYFRLYEQITTAPLDSSHPAEAQRVMLKLFCRKNVSCQSYGQALIKSVKRLAVGLSPSPITRVVT